MLVYFKTKIIAIGNIAEVWGETEVNNLRKYFANVFDGKSRYQNWSELLYFWKASSEVTGRITKHFEKQNVRYVLSGKTSTMLYLEVCS